MTRSAARPGPATSRPRTMAAGMPSVFPITSSAAPAAEVEQRADSRAADGDVGRPLPPGPAERVRDDDADGTAAQLLQTGAEPVGRGIRILRKEDNRAGLGRIRGVDAGRCADEAVLRLGDQERRTGADDAGGLSEDHFRLAWVPFGGELLGTGRCLNLGQVDDAALG